MGLFDIMTKGKEDLQISKEQRQQEKFMKAALKEARKAYDLKEVPIGCVIVRDGKIIARGYNRRNTDKSVLNHAEIIAIQKACKKTGDWRLEDCTMYITLEPCQMCAGAIVQARIPKVVIGSMNPKAGCAGSVINILQMSQFNHQVEIEKGICQEECSQILKDFFAELRENKKIQKKEAKEAEAAADAELEEVAEGVSEEFTETEIPESQDTKSQDTESKDAESEGAKSEGVKAEDAKTENAENIFDNDNYIYEESDD